MCSLENAFDVGIDVAVFDEADSFRVSELVFCCCFVKLRLDV